MHLTRSEVSRLWPIARKGNKYVVMPAHSRETSIPVLFALREMLKLAKTRTEAKRIIKQEKVEVNGKKIKDEKFALSLFDVLNVDGKGHRLTIKNKKFWFEETKESRKTAKVIGKTILAGGKAQINLNDGRNFITAENVGVEDSVVFDFKEGKIGKVIPLKEGAGIFVINGSHLGEEGKIVSIDEKSGSAEISIHKEKINLKLEAIMAV